MQALFCELIQWLSDMEVETFHIIEDSSAVAFHIRGQLGTFTCVARVCESRRRLTITMKLPQRVPPHKRFALVQYAALWGFNRRLRGLRYHMHTGRFSYRVSTYVHQPLLVRGDISTIIEDAFYAAECLAPEINEVIGSSDPLSESDHCGIHSLEHVMYLANHQLD